MPITRSQRKEWAKAHFRGAENIILPSFTPDLAELDEDGIRLDVRQSIRHGAFATFCSIEVGLTMEERLRFIEVAADEAGDEIAVSFALAGDTLEEDLALLEHAERVGASHALVSYPHGFAPETEEEVERFVRELCDATNLGICLFVNEKFGFQRRFHPSAVPFRAFDRLVELDNVIAMKVSMMDPAVVAACFERYGEQVLVSTPSIRQIPLIGALYDLQWTGAWTIEALQSPEQPLVIELMAALAARRPDEAMGIFGRMGPLLAAVGPRLGRMMPTGIYHWGLFKYFQWLTGGNGGLTRQPCMRLSQRDLDEVRGGFLAAGLELADGTDDEFFVGRAALARREAVAR